MRYPKVFYDAQRHGSVRSARNILPIVFDAVDVSTVLDVGCGSGTWLSVALDLGKQWVVGIEGEWVRDIGPLSPSIDMRFADLEESLPNVGTFDLTMCMEVAEHLSPGRAEGLVRELCMTAPNILFSAAVPYQGGVGHLNERPQSYWAGLFASHGYGALDIVRPATWSNGAVSYWYRQNAILYVRGAPATSLAALDRRHPGRFVNPWFVVELVARTAAFMGLTKGRASSSALPEAQRE